MMIKITESCSMGCSHCMNDAQPCSAHMKRDTYNDALNFVIKYASGIVLITGGEPTEHPQFEQFLEMALEDSRIRQVTVTTNGVWLQTHEHYARMIEGLYGPRRCFWQVTSDKRYYPTLIDLENPVFGLESMVICEEVPKIYPQGRAKTNNLPWEAKASKCFNARSITRQLYHRFMMSGKEVKLQDICTGLMAHGFFCTPDIGIHGEIRLGESGLCPSCATIYDDEIQIISKILSFKCGQCEFINKNLPSNIRALIGEK